MYRRVRRVRARSLGRGAAAAPGTRPASVSGRVDVSTPRSVRAGAVVARLPCGRVRAPPAPSGGVGLADLYQPCVSPIQDFRS